MSSGRRKLAAVDDPLATGAPRDPAPPVAEPARRRASEETAALYVRLRLPESERLARAAFELRVHTRELVGALIGRYVDATTEDGRSALRDAIDQYRRLCG